MFLLTLLAPTAAVRAQSPTVSDWGFTGGDAFGQHASSLDQINRGNVRQLTVAWIYRTGELGAGLASADRLTFEATPVLAFGTLYVTTGTDVVIALDPESGRLRWRFDPHIDRTQRYTELSSRGVAVWEKSPGAAGTDCARRVFVGTVDGRLLALDADRGSLCAGFGDAGEVDLTRAAARDEAPAYAVTSAPALLGNVVIIGLARTPARTAGDGARGVVRAFDAQSGAPLWSFDPLPATAAHPAAAEWDPAQIAGSTGGQVTGAMTIDTEHGLVFVPTGPASPEYYGGQRVGSNRLADSLLALDARSGQLVWQQQLVHHDLWDYRLDAQPVLGDVSPEGVPLPAVIEATRTGMLYLFERTHGRPLFPLIERPVPASRVAGEAAAATQPFSTLPALTPQHGLRPEEAWGLTVWDRGRCRERIAALRNEGLFTPPDEHGTLLLPGDLGGVSWGGIAYDADRGRVLAAVNLLPTVVTLLTPEEFERQRRSGDYPHAQFARQAGAPFGVRREPLLSPWGLPCSPPPWGTLVSVDLRRQRIAWQSPLGSSEGLTPWFVPSRNFGVPNLGGPIVTAGDLVFVAAAIDGYLRAFDIETGRELWKHRLPAGAQATPMTYRAGRDHRQFLVISAGGHAPLGTPRGDYLIAFALPRAAQSAP